MHGYILYLWQERSPYPIQSNNQCIAIDKEHLSYVLVIRNCFIFQRMNIYAIYKDISCTSIDYVYDANTAHLLFSPKISALLLMRNIYHSFSSSTTAWHFGVWIFDVLSMVYGSPSTMAIYRCWFTGYIISSLTHWGRDKLDAISQSAFFNSFSWKMFEFRIKFYWSLLLRAQLTTFQNWFR